MRIVATALLAAVLSTTSWKVAAVDENLLAHRLFSEGRYAEAAEIFTDPAWKGAALYRSAQWWRAADAFVRANDAVSAHNLGNAYVKLGYHALALQSYLRAYEIDPSLDDARFNAELMRQLLALENEDGTTSGQSASHDEIERLAGEEEAAREAGTGQGGTDDGDAGPEGDGDSERGDTPRAESDEALPGDDVQTDDDTREPARDGDGGGALDGELGQREVASRASGEAESDSASDDSQAAGLRRDLEQAQATEQWLNRIAHDPQRFLERRIALELRRRRAAGQSAPEGGSVW